MLNTKCLSYAIEQYCTDDGACQHVYLGTGNIGNDKG